MIKMKTIIISLGGSIVAGDNINIKFLKEFKKVINKFNYRFIIIVGGGKTARNYIEASKKFNIKSYDEDLIGIAATRLNAELVRSILNVNTPISYEPKKVNSKLIVSGGYKPGNSTDYVATLFAEIYNSKDIINMTKIGYVYDKNPDLKDAKKLKKLNWKEMQNLVGKKWEPGKNVPFDPIATKKAKKNNNRVVIINGNKNLENYLLNKKFNGTIIENEY